MECLKLSYMPQLDPFAVERNLSRLLVPGALSDEGLERRAVALDERFRSYCACYPFGLWTPGLVLTREMRSLTGLYLPLDEVRRAFERLFAGALRFSPFHPASQVHASTDWLDFLQKLQPVIRRANPASLLRCLMADEGVRRRFIFANFLPARYGGGFGRYPEQTEFLRRWLGKSRGRLAGEVRCLDAACGSGEGTYELALLLMESGLAVDSMHIHGATLEPLELFAAAHGYFPHDPARQKAYRQHIEPLLACGAAEHIRFFLEDLTKPVPPAGKGYDIIICNGLLGGPFLHDQRYLPETVARLAQRLRPGGILLAANHFHGGWKKVSSDDVLREMFAGCGLGLLPVAEGLAGVRPGLGTRD
jgi:SAM-dependent methyltransferase